MMSDEQIKNGEPVIYEYDVTYFEGCCDCGLSHYTISRKKNKDGYLKRVYRDDHKTEENRLNMPIEDLNWLIKELQRIRRLRRLVNKEAESEES